MCYDDASFPGEGQCHRLDVDGDGTYTAWTIGAGAGSEFQQVDDPATAIHDSDTTYLTSSASGEASTVTFESALSAGISSIIKCVKMHGISRESATSSSALQLELDQGV